MKTPKILFLLILLAPLILNPLGESISAEPTKQIWIITTTSIFTFYLGAKFFLEKKLPIFKDKTLLTLITLWSLSFLLSTIFALSPIESFYGEFQRLQGTFTHFFYLLFFLSALYFFKNQKNTEFIAKIIIYTSVPIALLAILQWLNLDPFFPKIDNFTGRAFATMGIPTSLGQYLIFPLSLLIFQLKDSLKSHARKKTLLHALLLTLIIFALILTKNRASILGISLTAMLFFYLSIKNKYLKYLLPTLGILATILVIFTIDPGTRSLGVREILWNSGIEAISQAPILGNGPESTYQSLQKTISPKLFELETISDIPDRAHNTLIEITLTRGLLGLSIFLLTILYLAKTYRKSKNPTTIIQKAAIFALLSYFISANFSFSLSVHIIYLLTFAAIIISPTLKWQQINLKKFNKYPPLILASLICLIAGTFSLRLLTTDIQLKNGIENFFYSKKQSMENFLTATTQSPYFAYPYRTAIILLSSYTNEIPDHRQKISSLIENLGIVTNYNFYYQLEKAKFTRNQPEISNHHFQKAANQAPIWPVIWMEWGETLYNQESYPAAIEKFNHTISLVPKTWKLAENQDNLPDSQKEKLRLFKKNNFSFYHMLKILAESYQKSGQLKKAEEIYSYL